MLQYNIAVESLPFCAPSVWYFLPQVDGVFSKVGYDPTADAQVARRTPTVGGEMQGQAAGGGGLPRIDLSTLLEKVMPSFFGLDMGVVTVLSLAPIRAWKRRR